MQIWMFSTEKINISLSTNGCSIVEVPPKKTSKVALLQQKILQQKIARILLQAYPLGIPK